VSAAAAVSFSSPRAYALPLPVHRYRSSCRLYKKKRVYTVASARTGVNGDRHVRRKATE